MAIITSHTLNGSNGSHAGGISVYLKNLNSNEIVFQTLMDSGGRLNEIVSPENIDVNAKYELVFKIRNYWEKHDKYKNKDRVVEEVVIRFKMPNKNKKYHFPIILSPNSYATWWSEGE